MFGKVTYFSKRMQTNFSQIGLFYYYYFFFFKKDISQQKILIFFNKKANIEIRFLYHFEANNEDAK